MSPKVLFMHLASSVATAPGVSAAGPCCTLASSSSRTANSRVDWATSSSAFSNAADANLNASKAWSRRALHLAAHALQPSTRAPMGFVAAMPRVAPSALNAASTEASSSAASFFSFVERLPSVPHVVVPASHDTSPVDICGPPWSPRASCILAATPSNADVTGLPCPSQATLVTALGLRLAPCLAPLALPPSIPRTLYLSTGSTPGGRNTTSKSPCVPLTCHSDNCPKRKATPRSKIGTQRLSDKWLEPKWLEPKWLRSVWWSFHVRVLC